MEPLSGSFGVLTPTDQWKVHAFYRPSERLTFEEFNANLREIKRRRPGLVHVAGKLSRQILTEAARLAAVRLEPMPSVVARGSKRRVQHVREVTVTGIVRPTPDLHKLAKAYLEIAKGMLEKEERDKQDTDDNSTTDPSDPTAS
ncbi:hypothetical protein [Sinomonas notoginsengisoli]|uniref:hypothetical protein n=1 Tax=Sinomonas notoginsengisoli TaxID=1457311 RepID=UPI001F3BD247|nr:hypothetical protein [Sinomonas notoginsengisoli]